MAMYSINELLKAKGSKIEHESEHEIWISTPAASKRSPERRQIWYYKSIAGVPIRQLFSDRPDWAHLGDFYFGGTWNDISTKIAEEDEIIQDSSGTGYSV